MASTRPSALLSAKRSSFTSCDDLRSYNPGGIVDQAGIDELLESAHTTALECPSHLRDAK